MIAAASTILTALPPGWREAVLRVASSMDRPDQFGWEAVEGRVHIHDLHATALHLLGLDHETTFRYTGRDFRLTDVYGTVVKEVLA